MTDNIFGERFYATRKPGWHNIGQVFAKALKPSVAVKKVGLDYTVDKYPMFAYPKKGVKFSSSKFVIMRSPTTDDPEWREFGIAAGKYEITQNTELAAIMDPLAEIWPLETAGAIANGKTLFMAFNTGGVEIAGDPINGYFTLIDQKDGGTSTKLIYTPVRIVCQNTLVTGLKQATVKMAIQHTTGAAAQIAARVSLISKARSAIDETTRVFRQLAATKISQAKAEKMFEAVYPMPKVPDEAALVDYDPADLGEVLAKNVSDTMYAYNYYSNLSTVLRDGAATLYEKLNDEHPRLAGTAWHAYNAVVESADFREGGESIEVSALFGQRAKEKKDAFEYAVSLIPMK